MRLQPKDRLFLRLFSSLLKQNVPREVRALDSYNTVFFTDACYERDHATWPCGIGGVFFCQKEVQYFSVKVDASIRKILGELHRKQIIFEAETLAAVVAFMLWVSRCESRRCILFVDNEGSKFSLLRGLSDNSVVDFLAEKFVEMEASVHTFTWLARVPSNCNVADAPSRGDVSGRLLCDAVDVSAETEKLMETLASQLLKLGKTGCDAFPASKKVRVSAVT